MHSIHVLVGLNLADSGCFLDGLWEIIPTLVDSGADTGGAHQKKLIPICNDKESDVSTCEEGGSLKSQGRGTMSFELPSGVQLDVPDSIYAKGLAHNVVGTSAQQDGNHSNLPQWKNIPC